MKFKKLFKIFFITIFIIFNLLYDKSLAVDLSTNNDITLYSESAILMEATTGLVLYNKNANSKMYPASTTKILTAIIAIENCNLDDVVTVNYSAISKIPAGYSSAYLSEGETITVKELLEVFLVHSANDAGYVLAEHISGSISEFSNLMNKKAEEIGCTNSHFLNPSGIHDDDHYTTAEDLGKIAIYCMKNSTFRSIVSMKTCTINPTNKSDARTYANTNDLINPSSKYYISDCVGIKTGYTSEAKNCLISAFSKDNLNLICVVLGSPTMENGSSSRYIDTTTLYNYGYSNFSKKTIASKGDTIQTIEIANATKETQNLDLVLENDIIGISNINESNYSYEVNLNNEISAPILENSVIGTVTYTSCGAKYTANLIASHDVNPKISMLGIFKIIFILVLTFLFLMLMLKVKRYKKKRSKRKYKYNRLH